MQKLLKRQQEIAIYAQDVPLARKADILADVALRLFMPDWIKLIFSQRQLLDALQVVLPKYGFDTEIGKTSDSLLKEFTGKAGLLRGREESGYFFLHLTFQEYLVATAIAHKLNENGVSATLVDGKETTTLLSLIRNDMRLYRWHQVIRFLLEEVTHPEALYQILRLVCPIHYIYDTIEEPLLHAVSVLKAGCPKLFQQLLQEISQEKEDDKILHRQLFLAAKIIGHTQFSRWKIRN